jgi:phosphate-selective porin OprO/OprP
MPSEVVGGLLEGRHNKWTYHLGIFSRNLEEEFSNFDSGAAVTVGIGYDTEIFDFSGSVHLDYLNNDRSEDDQADNAFRDHDHIASLWYRGSSGRMSLGLDFTAAQSSNESGFLWGITVEPGWTLRKALFNANDPMQAVLRYQYASSSEDNGLVLQRRYEQRVTEGDGNTYQALYAGLNYYLYDQKLKLMVGGEFARMEDDADDGGDYLGWSWFGALRLYF